MGLVYQRLNRAKEAERAYREAITKAEKLEPGPRERYLAHTNNALGYLKASSGRADEAEKFYRLALTHSPDLLEARHNLAVLLSGEPRRGQPDRTQEAFDLWRKNLAQDPEHLPSRISLARALSRQGQASEAIRLYTDIVEALPDYVAARLALAELHEKAGDHEAALEQLNQARTRQPENTVILEQIGDLEKTRGRTAQAANSYESALRYAPDRKTKKRLRKKLNR